MLSKELIEKMVMLTANLTEKDPNAITVDFLAFVAMCEAVREELNLTADEATTLVTSVWNFPFLD